MTNFDEKDELTPLQRKAVNLLVTGQSVTATAEKLDISRQTVSGWLNHDAHFNFALRKLQRHIFEEDIRRVRAITTKALDVMLNALDNEDHRIQMNAAKTILSVVGLSDAIEKGNQYYQNEYWRGATDAEKEAHKQIMEMLGKPIGDLSQLRIRMK